MQKRPLATSTRSEAGCAIRRLRAEDLPAICPISLDALREGEMVAVCDCCGAFHREGAWQEHGGCGIFSCACKPDRRQTDPQSVLRVSGNEIAQASASEVRPANNLVSSSPDGRIVIRFSTPSNSAQAPRQRRRSLQLQFLREIRHRLHHHLISIEHHLRFRLHLHHCCKAEDGHHRNPRKFHECMAFEEPRSQTKVVNAVRSHWTRSDTTIQSWSVQTVIKFYSQGRGMKTTAAQPMAAKALQIFEKISSDER